MSADRSPFGARPHREAGFSLVEVIVTLAAISIVLFGAMQFTSLAAESTRSNAVRVNELKDRGEGMQKFREILAQSHVTRISPDGETLFFRLPVPMGVGGSYMDADGELLFGTRGPGGPVLDESYQVVFVRERIVDERVEGRSLNFDADRTDVFEIGNLEIRTEADVYIATILTHVVRPFGQPGGDVDGDGRNDPLFEMDGLKLKVRFAYPNPAGYVVIWQTRALVTASSV